MDTELNKQPIFISYFTPDNNYPQQAQRLADSLETFDLQHDIQEIKPFTSWQNGINHKPTYILNQLIKYRRTIIWIDADCYIKQYPTLLMQDNDFSILNWYAITDHNLSHLIPYDPHSPALQCSGGVQKWGYTAPAIELLIRWIDAINQNPDKLDDPNLDTVFNSYHPPVKPIWLPKTYNRMTDLYPNVNPTTIVIENEYDATSKHRTKNPTTNKKSGINNPNQLSTQNLSNNNG